jgi:hypothetical protein
METSQPKKCFPPSPKKSPIFRACADRKPKWSGEGSRKNRIPFCLFCCCSLKFREWKRREGGETKKRKEEDEREKTHHVRISLK